MEKKEANAEKCTDGFTKKIGNTTFTVNVHFARNTTDTIEDRLIHLISTVQITDSEPLFAKEQKAG